MSYLLSAIPLMKRERVVHLLASLPKSYDMLVTALEASQDVPKWALVTERLLYEENKMKEKTNWWCWVKSHDIKTPYQQKGTKMFSLW